MLTYSARCMLKSDTLLGNACGHNSLHVREVRELLNGCSVSVDCSGA